MRRLEEFRGAKNKTRRIEEKRGVWEPCLTLWQVWHDVFEPFQLDCVVMKYASPDPCRNLLKYLSSGSVVNHPNIPIIPRL